MHGVLDADHISKRGYFVAACGTLILEGYWKATGQTAETVDSANRWMRLSNKARARSAILTWVLQTPPEAENVSRFIYSVADWRFKRTAAPLLNKHKASMMADFFDDRGDEEEARSGSSSAALSIATAGAEGVEMQDMAGTHVDGGDEGAKEEGEMALSSNPLHD